MLPASPNPESPQLLYWDSDMALGSSSHLFFCLWRNRTTPAGVAKFAAVIREYARDHEPDIGIITIIEPGAKMPEPGAREALSKLLKTQGGKVVISAVAFEGDGFMAAAVRGVVVGLNSLARQPFPHRVFANIQEISTWFEAKQAEVGVAFPAAETRRYEAEFRRQLGVAVEGKARHISLGSGAPTHARV